MVTGHPHLILESTRDLLYDLPAGACIFTPALPVGLVSDPGC